MSTPKISIVMPSLNVASYIRPCIESALSQTLSDIEIICVDAGSTDGTVEILQEYAESDRRITIIHSEKKSYGYQVNIGFDAAQGEYLAILETDDIIKANMYERLYAVAKIYNLDIIKGDFYKFEESATGHLLKTKFQVAKPGMYNRVLTADDKKMYLKNTSIYTWCGIYRRAFIQDNNIRHNETPGASYQDNGFWFMTMSTAKNIYFFNEPFYLLRRDNPNSSVFSKNKVYCICEEYEYILECLKEKPNLYDEVISLYWKHLFGAYKFTYNRIDDKFKAEFMDRYQETLKRGLDSHELVESVFNKSEWREIMQIINRNKNAKSPILNSQNVPHNANFIRRFLNCSSDHGFVYAVKYTLQRVKNKLFRNKKTVHQASAAVPAVNINMKDFMTKGDYYTLLDEIHGVERNVLMELYKQNNGVQ